MEVVAESDTRPPRKRRSILSERQTVVMNEIQQKLADLTGKGWTLVAVADEIGEMWLTVYRWQTGKTYPDAAQSVMSRLNDLTGRKIIPKPRGGYGTPLIYL